MSNSIDQHIVGLDFDTTKFDKGVARASEGLDKFQSKLKFEDTTSSFSKIESALKNVGAKIGPIASIAGQGLSSISAKASAVVSDIIDKFSTIASVAKVSIGAIGATVTGLAASGGIKRALNIQQAKFQLQGLGADVEGIMKNVNDAVTGTAYGLDQAAIVASQLTASGVQAGEQMTNILKGVAGVASMTGKDFGEVGHIFTTVASQGKLMTMQMRQLEWAGLNVAATLSKAWGVSEAEVHEMVTKGEVSFEMFANAMTDAFGTQAQRANELFTGSLSNVKAALSRIGERFATPGIEHLRDIFNALRPVINDVNTALTPVVDLFVKWSDIGSTKVIDFLNNLNTNLVKITKYGEGLKSFTSMLDTMFSAFSDSAIDLGKFLNLDLFSMSYWDFLSSELFKGIDQFIQALAPLFSGDFINGVASTSDVISMVSDKVSKFNMVIGPINGTKVQDFAASVGLLFDSFIKTDKTIGGLNVSKLGEFLETIGVSSSALYGFNHELKSVDDILKGNSPFTTIQEAFTGILFGDFFKQQADESETELKDLNTKVQEFLHPPEKRTGIKAAVEDLAKAGEDLSGKLSRFNTEFSALNDPSVFGSLARNVHAFKEWAGNIKFSDEQIRSFGVALRNIKGIASGAGTILKGAFDGLTSALGPLADLIITKVFPDLVQGFNNLFSGFENGLPSAMQIADALRNAGKTIGDFFTALKNGDTTFIDGLKDTFTNIFGPLIEAAKNSGIIGALGEAVGKLFQTLFGPKSEGSGITDIFGNILDFFKNAPKTIGEVLPQILGGIGQFLGSLNISADQVLGLLNAILLIVSIRDFRGMAKTFSDVGNKIKDFWTSWIPEDLNSINKIFDSLSGLGKKALEPVTKALNNLGKALAVDNILKVGIAIGILAASLFLLSRVNPEDLVAPLLAIVAMGYLLRNVLNGIMDAFSGRDWTGGKIASLTAVGTVITALATALLVMSAAVFIMSKMDPASMLQGLAGVAALMYGLTKVMESIASLDKGAPLLKAAFSIMGIASALLLLTGIVAILGHMKPETILQGLASVVLMLATFAGTLKVFGEVADSGSIIKATFAINGLVAALIGMTAIILVLGSLSFEQLASATFGLGISLLALWAGMEALSHVKIKTGDLAKVVILMGAVTGALFSLSIVCAIFSSMGLEQLGVGLLGMAGSLLVVVGAVALLSKVTSGGDLVASAFSLGLVASAVVALSIALSAMGSLSLEQMGTALLGLGAGLLFMGVALEAMRGSIGGAASLLVAVAAINLLVPTLLILSGVDITQLCVSLVALGAGLVVLSVALRAIQAAIPAIVALAVTFQAFGISVAAIGVGLFAAAAAFHFLNKIGFEALSNLVNNLNMLLPQILTLIVGFVAGLLESFTTLVPAFATAGVALITSLLYAIQAVVPQFVLTGISIIIQIMQGLIQAAPTLVSTGYQLLITLINSLANTIREQHDAMYQAGKNLFLAVLEAMWDCLQHLGNDLGSFLMDLPAIISGQKPLFESAGTEMGDSVTNSASESMAGLGDIATEGVNAVSGTFQNMDMSGIEGSFNAIPEALSTSMGEMGTIAEGGGMTFADSFIGSASSGLANSGFTEQIMASLGGMDTSSLGATKASEFIAPFQDTGPATAAGTGFGEAIASGAEPGMDKMVEGARTKSGEAISSVSGRAGEANNAGNAVGANLGSGMYSGMGAWMGAIATRAADMVRNAKRAADKEANSASPSKEMIKRGLWFGQGFEIGISKMIAPVSRMSADMVNEALGATEKYSLVMNSVNGLDWDMSPVIRPQLDLSEIEAGVAYMNSMLMTQGVINAAMSGSLVGADGTLLGASQPAGPVYNLYIDGAIVNSTPDIQRVIYETFEVVSAYGGMNHGN